MKTPWSKAKPLEDRSPIWWFRWVPTIVISALLLYVLYVIGSVAIVPVLASFALAYLLNPVVFQAEKYGLSRAVSAIVAILLVALVVTAFLAYVVPDLWAESAKAGANIAENFTPENAARQREFLRRYSPALEKVAGEKIERFLSEPVSFYNETVSEPTTAIVDTDGKVKPASSGGSGAAILAILSSSFDLLLVPFFVFYILIDFQKWRDSLESLIPPRFRKPFSNLFDESGRILESYVRGQLLIGMIMAVCYAIGFYFLDVPAWAGIALIAGLLNAVPYVGTTNRRCSRLRFQHRRRRHFRTYCCHCWRVRCRTKFGRLHSDTENFGRKIKPAPDGGFSRSSGRRKTIRTARRDLSDSDHRHSQSVSQISA